MLCLLCLIRPKSGTKKRLGCEHHTGCQATSLQGQFSIKTHWWLVVYVFIVRSERVTQVKSKLINISGITIITKTCFRVCIYKLLVCTCVWVTRHLIILLCTMCVCVCVWTHWRCFLGDRWRLSHCSLSLHPLLDMDGLPLAPLCRLSEP